MAQKKNPVGRPASKDHLKIKTQILKLKGQINPATHTFFTYEEIGKRLNMTGQNAWLYVRGTKGICPTCVRPFPKAHKPTKAFAK